MNILGGKRILVVEDELMVAGFIEDALGDLGVVVIGPVGRIDEGLALARSELLDAAVLDINLKGKRSDPIAEILTQRGIPFIFSTGYGNARTDIHTPVLAKPYTDKKLANALTRIFVSSPDK